RQQSAETGPPLRVTDEQGQMTRRGGGILARHRHLRTVDRPQPDRRSRLRELHRAREGVVIGEGERRVPALHGGDRELGRERRSVQERERGVAVELDVRHRTHVRIWFGRLPSRRYPRPRPTRRVYTSLPMTGPSGPPGREVLRGAELALERVGDAPVELIALDAGGHDREERAVANARRAAE